LVRGRAALRMKSDLVDADRLRPVIRPEVRMDLETRWLPRSQEQLLGERARDGRLADRFLAGEAVRVRQAAGPPVSLQDRDGAVVARDRRKTESNRDSIPTRPRGWQAANSKQAVLEYN